MDESLAQQINSHLQEIRGELVRARELSDRQQTAIFESVDEEQFTNSGTSVRPNPIMTAEVKVDVIILYTADDGHTRLYLHDNSPYGIPIPKGLTVISPVGLVYKGSDRPSLKNSSTAAEMYIAIQGHQAPSRAEAL